MNRRQFREEQIRLRKEDQVLFKRRLRMQEARIDIDKDLISLQIEKATAEINMITQNTRMLKDQMKNLYKECVAEVKNKEKERDPDDPD